MTGVEKFAFPIGLMETNKNAAAIQSTKESFGFFFKEKRDMHTKRWLGITSLGGVFFSEGTEEQHSPHQENREEGFWSSPEECAAKCRALLADEDWRRSIAEKGHQRYLKNGWTNMKVAEKILNAALD